MPANLTPAAVVDWSPSVLPGRLAPIPPECEVAPAPAIFHVTHPKAGSQWLRRILTECCPERVFVPREDLSHFLRRPLAPAGIYPALYVTRQQFESVALPPHWQRLVVIRDLRDTLVSCYFSVKYSHTTEFTVVREWRQKLRTLSVEDGLIWLLEAWLHRVAAIQQSWLESGDQLIRYEDLLEYDLEILEPILLDDCQLPITPGRLREVVLAARFERLTGGRARGQEDLSAHERKGVAGDWRCHFTPRVVEHFKERHGDLLLALGYEHDWHW
jgi:lipopolysaccharide transport system ATP-binding protein